MNSLKNINQQINQKLKLMNLPTQMLFSLWVMSSLFMILGLMRDIAPVKIIGAILGIAYTLVMVWWLIQSKPKINDFLPHESPVKFLPNSRMMLVFIIILTLIFMALTSILLKDGWLMLLMSMPLSLLIIILWRKHINKRFILVSLGVLIVLAFVEQILGADMSSGLILPLGAALMFLAGVILLDDSKLSQIHFLKGEYLSSGKSFLLGCLLAVPASLINIISIQLSAPSEFDRLFDRWWEPLYAFQPGILEEIWARLLLTTLIYTFLRPIKRLHSSNSVIWAIIIAAFIHAMAHYPGSVTNPLEVIFITVIYGIPLGFLFVKRDLEHAIAYHFFIDLIRFSMYYVWNSLV